jgi:hypothetical protein
MAYNAPYFETYQWAEDATFGSTAITHNIMGPRGRVGFVRDISVDVTTALVGTTTVPEIRVGFSSGDFTYGRYRLGSTISLGYAVGIHRASIEAWSGNPPRTLNDFASHVVLDGGPLTSQGIAGGSYGTVVPAGRIPTGPLQITNVILGTTANSNRVFVNGLTPGPGGISVGQKVLVAGVAGVNSTENAVLTVAAIDTTNYQWVELTTQTFSGAYTGGGWLMPLVVVTSTIGVGGSPAGGGIIRVHIQWIGTDSGG